MRKYLLLPTLALLLTACVNDEVEQPKKQPEPSVEKQESKEESKKEVTEPTEEVVIDKEIDTSVYQYASKVDVTDAREINDHITLMIDMKTDNHGMAFQHVLNQTYDFLQQPEITDAKTISVNIRVDGKKIAMFTAHPGKLKTNDEESMAQLVLDASVVEMVLPTVEDYATAMELKMNKE